MSMAYCSKNSDLAKTAQLAMSKARSALVLNHPFFGSLALKLRLQEDPTCQDLWTDGKVLAFNPVYAGTLPEEKLVAAQAHEVLHLAFGHHLRRKDREATLWNKACDLAINHILLEAGFSLPKGFVHDPAYAEMSADKIYDLLFKMQEQESNGGAENANQSGETESSGEAKAMNFDGGHELSAQTTVAGADQDNENTSEYQENAVAVQGKAASNVDGGKRPDANTDKSAFTGEVRDHPGITGQQSDQAQKAAEQEADITLMQAMQRALHMGSMPAGFLRLLKQSWSPKLDWRDLLRRFLENCADNDYSWTMPNFRYLHQDMYLPSRREARIPCIALAIDSSGSVDEQALNAFCAELSSILEAYDTTLNVLFHDCKIQKEHIFTRMDFPIALTPQGGGGTDFRPVCEHIAGQHLQPTCLIWFTDLECSLFPKEPPYPVLWVCSQPTPEPPPFGEVVTLVEASAC